MSPHPFPNIQSQFSLVVTQWLADMALYKMDCRPGRLHASRFVSLGRAPVPLPCARARILGETNCLVYKQGPRCVAGSLFHF